MPKTLSEITTTIIETVIRLVENHLGEITKLTKESKSKLEKSVQSLEHRLNYLQYWKEKLMKNVSKETNLNIKKGLVIHQNEANLRKHHKTGLFKVRNVRSG